MPRQNIRSGPFGSDPIPPITVPIVGLGSILLGTLHNPRGKSPHSVSRQQTPGMGISVTWSSREPYICRVGFSCRTSFLVQIIEGRDRCSSLFVLIVLLFFSFSRFYVIFALEWIMPGLTSEALVRHFPGETLCSPKGTHCPPALQPTSDCACEVGATGLPPYRNPSRLSW